MLKYNIFLSIGPDTALAADYIKEQGSGYLASHLFRQQTDIFPFENSVNTFDIPLPYIA